MRRRSCRPPQQVGDRLPSWFSPISNLYWVGDAACSHDTFGFMSAKVQAPWLFVLDDPGFDAAAADHPFGRYEIVPARSVLSIS